jgi:hypothetical protein
VINWFAMMKSLGDLGKTVEQLESEAASRLIAARHTPGLRDRQILLMEFERLRALASKKRRATEPRKPGQ